MNLSLENLKLENSTNTTWSLMLLEFQLEACIFLTLWCLNDLFPIHQNKHTWIFTLTTRCIWNFIILSCLPWCRSYGLCSCVLVDEFLLSWPQCWVNIYEDDIYNECNDKMRLNNTCYHHHLNVWIEQTLINWSFTFIFILQLLDLAIGSFEKYDEGKVCILLQKTQIFI
jgi:hypothetical protein